LDSTQDQNLDLQIEALTKAGCEKVFREKTNPNRAERPEFTKALERFATGTRMLFGSWTALAEASRT
jgi:DNA invertase Pin-like site-specific DNA recombinase